MPANNYFTETEFDTAYADFKCCYGTYMAGFAKKQAEGTQLSTADRQLINVLKAMQYVFSTYVYGSADNLLTDQEVYAVMNNSAKICNCQ